MRAISCPFAARRWFSCIARSFLWVLACSSIPGFDRLFCQRDASCLPHPKPAAETLLWELRKDLLVEPRQLTCLVLDRPQENLLDPCRLEPGQFFGALGRRPNKQTLVQQFDRAAQRRTHHLH